MKKYVVVITVEREIELYDNDWEDYETAYFFMRDKLNEHIQEQDLELSDEELEDYRDDEWGYDKEDGTAFSNLGDINFDAKIFEIEV